MKIRYVPLLISIFFSGCVAPNPVGVAMLQLDAIQGSQSPSIRKESIDGKEVIMAKRGLWFVEPDALPALVALIRLHQSHGSWPQIEQTGNKMKTRIQNHGAYLKGLAPQRAAGGRARPPPRRASPR